MSDIKFVDGLFIKAPNENAPDFVKAAISIKRSALISWLTKQEGDWINLDAKESKAGKWYISVNDFKPSKQDNTAAQIATPQPQTPPNDFDPDIPF
ncbi:MAG: hypothetical protein KAR06_03625 [Deltaproteobacteria bacterium]|nr:hypothetical protein [Deltaproteobacteria bacterium]